MMDSNGQTRNLLSQQIKKEFECDIIYEPIKREMVEEDSSINEFDNDLSDSEDDVFYDSIEPGLPKKDAKLMEEKPCKSHEFTDDISENDTGFTHYKNYNLSCHREDFSESSGLDSDLKNALENPTYEVDCDQKEGVLIMNMINEKFSLGNKNNSSSSKNSLMNKAKCKTEIEDDIEIVYDDIVWEDSSENNALVISEVCKKSLDNETELINRKSGRTGRQGQKKVILDSTNNVLQGENSSEEKMSCSSIEPTKDSAVLPIFHGDVDNATVIKRNLSASKGEIKLLKVLLHRNFGLTYSSRNNGYGSIFYDSGLKYPKSSRKKQRLLQGHNQKEEKPQCAICKKKFNSEQLLLSHIERIHESDRPFQCELCSKAFTLRHRLLRHEKIHKRINPYHCKVCLKSFFNKTVFTRHEQSHEEKLFNCQLCSASFRNSSSLDNHSSRNHNQRPFHCTFCPKSFSCRYLLATHERIHKGEKPFRCKYCPKSFADKAHLPVHERTHSGERPFVCEVCTKSFTQSGHLRVHEKIHIGKRPFGCKICSKSFIYKSSLTSHERIHKSEKERFRTDKYHCKFCSKSYQSKSCLNIHEITHSEDNRFRCKFCSKSYSAKSSLVAHEKTH